MDGLYERLRKDYANDKVEQLVFLYYFLSDDEKFEKMVDEMRLMNADEIQQVIKCITHNLPYEPLLCGDIEEDQMNEIRRFMEDADVIKDSRYLEMAKRMAELSLNKNIIYEFRRFAKCIKPLTYEEYVRLFDFVCWDPCMSWLVLAGLYHIYIAYDFNFMINFSEKWSERILKEIPCHFSPKIASEMYLEVVNLIKKKKECYV